jgi:hypothetical protein
MAHGGAGGAAQGLITQEVVQAFVSDFPGLGLIQARVTQIVIQSFVNDTPLTTPPATGVNTGTPICQPYSIHLDRKCRLLGVYSAGTGYTTWTLPILDTTLTTIVLASAAFGSNNGKIMVGTYDTGVVSIAGDWSAGYAVIGRPFLMSVELSRPYRRNRLNEAIISDRLQHAVQYFSHRNTGDYTIRVATDAPPSRSDRTKDFTVSTIGAVEEQGETRTSMSGWAEKTHFFVESDSPRPCTISAIKYTVDVTEDQG